MSFKNRLSKYFPGIKEQKNRIQENYPLIRNSKITNYGLISPEAQITESKIFGDIPIGKGCYLESVTLFGNVYIDQYTSLNGPGTDFIAPVNSIRIGKFCSIARGTSFQENLHNYEKITTYFIRQRIFKEPLFVDSISKGDIIVGNDVWIGAQCVILSGVTIGHGAVIAANSVVTKDVPPYAIVGGSPAKIIRYRFDEEIVNRLLRLEWWHWDLDKIKRNRDLFVENLTLETLNNIIN